MLNQKAKIGYQMCIKTKNIRCIIYRNNAVSSVNQIYSRCFRKATAKRKRVGTSEPKKVRYLSYLSVVINIISLVAAKEIFRLMITPAISETLGVEEVQEWAEVTFN